MSAPALRYQCHVADEAEIAAAAYATLSADPSDTAAGMAEGWFGVGLDEAAGGSGGTLRDLAAVLEACGAALSASTLPFATGVVGRLLGSAGAAPATVAALASGELLVAVSVTVGELLAPAATGGRVSASVLAAGPSHAALALPVLLDRGPALVVLPPQTAGVSARAVDALDVTRSWSLFDLVEVDLSAYVVAELPGLLMDWRSQLGLVCALDAVGAACAALELTIEHAKVRHQFGRPLGSFQAYQHRCASAFVDLKLAQSVAYRAAASADDPAEFSLYALSAAVEATRAATSVCKAAVQLHGGIGFSWEGQVHKYLRRARANELIGGGAGAQLALLTAVSG